MRSKRYVKMQNKSTLIFLHHYQVLLRLNPLISGSRQLNYHYLRSAEAVHIDEMMGVSVALAQNRTEMRELHE